LLHPCSTAKRLGRISKKALPLEQDPASLRPLRYSIRKAIGYHCQPILHDAIGQRDQGRNQWRLNLR